MCSMAPSHRFGPRCRRPFMMSAPLGLRFRYRHMASLMAASCSVSVMAMAAASRIS